MSGDDATERQVKQRVLRVLRKHCSWVRSMGAGPTLPRGTPDIFALYSDRLMVVECKAAGGRLTKLQKRELREIGEAGGIALVVCGCAGVDYLEWALEAADKMTAEEAERWISETSSLRGQPSRN